jgi:hypothetical protein
MTYYFQMIGQVQFHLNVKQKLYKSDMNRIKIEYRPPLSNLIQICPVVYVLESKWRFTCAPRGVNRHVESKGATHLSPSRAQTLSLRCLQ